MINKSKQFTILLNILGIIAGLTNMIIIDSKVMHIVYVIIVSTILIVTVLQEKPNYIRPNSYLILSFFVFVWMRYILNVLYDMDIISIGGGINFVNTSIVSIYLGISINMMCITSIIVEGMLKRYKMVVFESDDRIVVPSIAEKAMVIIAIAFFLLFIIDSIQKVYIVKSADYLTVSENVLLQGYRYFSFGKYFLILWMLFGKDSNRFFKACTILMIASVGYLLRGSRGYAIMYIFMWLLFFSFRHRIRLVPLMLLGIALVYLANFILSYRLGWTVASGFKNIIISTLNSQGASVEPVFGSVIFRKQILEQFSIYELFTRNDFGIIVDRVRGTGFELGGFGSSFFAEAYFLGFPLNILMIVVAGLCVGILEYAYNTVVYNKEKSEYSQIILYMTIPNLIYLGRSSVKDFVFKTIATLIIVLSVQIISRTKIWQRIKEKACMYEHK